MSGLLDFRLGRLAFALLVLASAGSTAVILLGAGHRSSAQLAALAALRTRPVTHAAAPSTTSASGGGQASGSGGSGGGGTGSDAGGGLGAGGSHARHASGGGSSAGASTPASRTPAADTGSSTPTTTTQTTQTSTTSTTSTTGPAADLPKVEHVFELAVSAPSYAAAFGAHSTLPYLRTLAHRGTLLTSYRSLGAGELADELALVSGQGPNSETAHGCPSYDDFPNGTVANQKGLVPGRGCVYPDTALTIGDQVTASGKVWHAYIEDMGSESCVHPNSDAVDDIALPFSKPGYDDRHNPFIYFHSLLDLGDCSNDDVDLTHLTKALHSAGSTPRFTYVAANACADADPTMIPATTTTTTTTTTSTSSSATSTAPGTSQTTTPVTVSTPTSTTATSATTATSTTTTSTTSSTATTPAGCPAGSTSGPTAENAFLKEWIPRILASAAYRSSGVLIIAVTSGPKGAGHPVRTGALVVSRWARRGHRIAAAANPYALLRVTEDLFGFTRLAHAATAPSLAATLLPVGH